MYGRRGARCLRPWLVRLLILLIGYFCRRGVLVSMLERLLEIIKVHLVHFFTVWDTGALQVLHHLRFLLSWSLVVLLWVVYKDRWVLLLHRRGAICRKHPIFLGNFHGLLGSLGLGDRFLVHRLSQCFVAF